MHKPTSSILVILAAVSLLTYALIELSPSANG